MSMFEKQFLKESRMRSCNRAEFNRLHPGRLVGLILFALLFAGVSNAQQGGDIRAKQEAATMTERERALLDRIEKLERRLAEIEARASATALPAPAPAVKQAADEKQTGQEDRGALDFFRDTTINMTVD
jgi:hypothetical protein